jgi:glycine oxidase
MTTKGRDVVIIGGGIVGIATAYFLGRAGVKSVVVEKDSLGSHASGFAYGGLSALGGSGIPGPNWPVARESMRLHHEFSRSLPEETGIDTEYRAKTALTLAFTDQDVLEVKARLSWQDREVGYSARWVDDAEARSIEPRVSDQVLGGAYIEGNAELEPYRFLLALAQSAEKLGATIRHGEVTGLKRDGTRVTAVVLESQEIPCDSVVVAMGPWSGGTTAWLGVPIEVTPMKGQLLRLRAPGPPITSYVGWQGNRATTKPDGLVWAGTTEEEVGFDESPTPEARDMIMAAVLKMMPSLADAELAQQTACLRPWPADGLLVLGPVPGWDGVYMATGAGRAGIVHGPAMGRITADLITTGATDIPIEGLEPGRFLK